MNSKSQSFDSCVLILGDQLSACLSSLKSINKSNSLILMMEVLEEATYVKHHPQKIILIFSAMRHFANELTMQGFHVHYLKLTDKGNCQNFTANLYAIHQKYDFQNIILTEPSEYRVLSMVEKWKQELSVNIEVRPDDRFLFSIAAFQQWAKGKKQLRMENFYRMIRTKTGILMSKDKPLGGKWNYDKENRLPAAENEKFGKPLVFPTDDITQDVIELINSRFQSHFGKIDSFNFAVNRKGALKALNFFIKHHLKDFGKYQDAMLEGEYTLHHSLLSAYMNIGLLTPREVIEKIEKAYTDNLAPINSVEGYIRQILGWREYVRGIYWLSMPEYADLNFFNATHALPNFYWSAETDMACMKHAITQTKETATSHHIQRLMITGNFALLYGVLPEAICEWYLAVYADAFEWVELPNTLGMSQFADGGLLASKPYASSGNYINKMSNFCKHCVYSVKEKLTENACPFNYLYWDFLIRNKAKLESNPRLGFAYKYIANLSDQDKKQYSVLSNAFRKKCQKE